MDIVTIKSVEYLKYLIVATKNGDLEWKAQNWVGKNKYVYTAKLVTEDDADIWLIPNDDGATIEIRGLSEGENRIVYVAGDEDLIHELHRVVRAQHLSRNHDFATRLVDIAVEYLDKHKNQDETK